MHRCFSEKKKMNTFKNSLKARSLMVSNLGSETKGSRSESGR